VLTIPMAFTIGAGAYLLLHLFGAS
jgi:hypothetical protein